MWWLAPPTRSLLEGHHGRGDKGEKTQDEGQCIWGEERRRKDERGEETKETGETIVQLQEKRAEVDRETKGSVCSQCLKLLSTLSRADDPISAMKPPDPIQVWFWRQLGGGPVRSAQHQLGLGLHVPSSQHCCSDLTPPPRGAIFLVHAAN